MLPLVTEFPLVWPNFPVFKHFRAEQHPHILKPPVATPLVTETDRYTARRIQRSFWKMKPETHGIPIEEFVGVRPKMYSIMYMAKNKQIEKKTAKRIKKSATKREIRLARNKEILLEKKRPWLLLIKSVVRIMEFNRLN